MFQPALMHTDWGKGRRDFVFPPLPDALSVEKLMDICTQWVEEELVIHGMACEVQLFKNREVTFSCTTRPFLGDGGFGEIVEEWGTTGFFVRVKASFAKAVNDELEAVGLARSYVVM